MWCIVRRKHRGGGLFPFFLFFGTRGGFVRSALRLHGREWLVANMLRGSIDGGRGIFLLFLPTRHGGGGRFFLCLKSHLGGRGRCSSVIAEAGGGAIYLLFFRAWHGGRGTLFRFFHRVSAWAERRRSVSRILRLARERGRWKSFLLSTTDTW